MGLGAFIQTDQGVIMDKIIKDLCAEHVIGQKIKRVDFLGGLNIRITLENDLAFEMAIIAPYKTGSQSDE